MPLILATWEDEICRIAVQGQPKQIIHETPHLQINQSQIYWRCASSGKVPALQAWSPVQTCPTKKKKKKKKKRKKVNK
jgi:hypothetical protein